MTLTQNEMTALIGEIMINSAGQTIENRFTQHENEAAACREK